MGAINLLVNLVDIVEVLPVPAVQSVPLTKPWFRGMTNVRGNLYGLTDLSHFLAQGPTTDKASNRILLFNSVQTSQAAILLDGVLGLRNVSTLTKLDGQPLAQLLPQLANWQQFFSAECYQDHQDKIWLTLNVDVLVRDSQFINPSIV